MSIAQMKRRIDALQSRPGLANPRAFTLEELHRTMWRQHKRTYLEMAREGHHDVQFFLKQFEEEEALKVPQALHRNRGIR